MREIWVHADPWDKELVTTALESGADAVIVPPDRVETVRQLGRITTVAENGDLQWERDVVFIDVLSTEDEETVVRESKEKRVVIRTPDWKIIPLENLVSRTGNLMVETEGIDQARTAAGILEKGVDGLILTERNPALLRDLISSIRLPGLKVEMNSFRITEILTLGLGDRVCVDTCSLMEPGQGALVGSSNKGLFLMHAENQVNPYVAPRPFRINAGAVHAYILAPDGRTKYLSELKAGDSIAGTDSSGELIPLVVGRVKIERRPLLLVRAEGPFGEVTTICQNAETIRLVRADEHESVSVIALSPGDEVLGLADQGGRHFGRKIEETILER
jgi:3-dehydroquinate synthase II